MEGSGLFEENMRKVLADLANMDVNQNQLVLILKQRSSLKPATFISYLIKYGIQLKKLFTFISLIENNLHPNSKWVAKMK